jgi:hypothetical protein
MSTEADTFGDWVVPKLQMAHCDNGLCFSAAQRWQAQLKPCRYTSTTQE